jgi:hypothetical protein
MSTAQSRQSISSYVVSAFTIAKGMPSWLS